MTRRELSVKYEATDRVDSSLALILLAGSALGAAVGMAWGWRRAGILGALAGIQAGAIDAAILVALGLIAWAAIGKKAS